jgi:hypothetical protein
MGFRWLGYRVQGLGFRVQDSELRAQGSGFKVQGSGFRVQGSRLRARLSSQVVLGCGTFPRQRTCVTARTGYSSTKNSALFRQMSVRNPTFCSTKAASCVIERKGFSATMHATRLCTCASEAVATIEATAPVLPSHVVN